MVAALMACMLVMTVGYCGQGSRSHFMYTCYDSDY